ncbi:MAG: hypothetical protein VXX55_07230 [Planctomycetota bacterium]|nr:hypothetical protein [Planctomycetota bacterium]
MEKDEDSSFRTRRPDGRVERNAQAKKTWDLTGNGVNHPNDFGHRVYAQVRCELLKP